jgi:hypothetical protein
VSRDTVTVGITVSLLLSPSILRSSCELRVGVAKNQQRSSSLIL